MVLMKDGVKEDNNEVEKDLKYENQPDEGQEGEMDPE